MPFSRCAYTGDNLRHRRCGISTAFPARRNRFPAGQPLRAFASSKPYSRAISRAMPVTLRQSGRFDVTLMSNTVSAASSPAVNGSPGRKEPPFKNQYTRSITVESQFPGRNRSCRGIRATENGLLNRPIRREVPRLQSHGTGPLRGHWGPPHTTGSTSDPTSTLPQPQFCQLSESSRSERFFPQRRTETVRPSRL